MPQREQVRDQILQTLPALAQGVVAELQEEIPTYASLTAAQLSEVLAIAEWGIDRTLALWVDDAELGTADIQRFRSIGRVRALDGRPLAGVLRAYRLAGRRVMDAIVAHAGADLTVRDALDLSNVWMSTIDILSEALYEGHDETSLRMLSDRSRPCRTC